MTTVETNTPNRSTTTLDGSFIPAPKSADKQAAVAQSSPQTASDPFAVAPNKAAQPTRLTISAFLGGKREEAQDVAKEFPNGDTYYGGWLPVAGMPHGIGCYTWADGSVFEGEWVRGQKHGNGLFVWPSGARYQGEWKAGQMQVRIRPQ